MRFITKPGNFEDLIVWQRGRGLFTEIHFRTSRGPLGRDFAFRNQLRKAAHSIPSNIAEGFGRYSEKEFLRFLSIANGSAYEVRSHIKLAAGIRYLGEREAEDLENRCREVSRLIEGLRKSLLKNL